MARSFFPSTSISIATIYGNYHRKEGSNDFHKEKENEIKLKSENSRR